MMTRLAKIVAVAAWISTDAAAVTLTFGQSPSPPDAGDNALDIKLEDGSGQPPAKVDVDVAIFMPSMGTMPRMNVKSHVASLASGSYRATFALPMQGTWVVVIAVGKAAAKETFRYSMTTGVPGLVADGNNTAAAGATEAPLIPVGPDRLQQIGVRFAEAQVVPLTKALRVAGLVEADKSRRTELALRFSGYVEKQMRGRIGDFVAAGAALFTVYSPDLVSAESEFLQSHGAGDSGATLHQSTVDRLRNLGLSDGDIARIKKGNAAERTLVVKAPQAGTILEVNVHDGTSFGQGQTLYVIGDLSKSYIVGRVFQRDLADLTVGQGVAVVLPEDEGKSYKGHVDLIYPSVGEGDGTGNVRVVLDEAVAELRPGLYVDLRFPIDLGRRLAVPTTAVLYSGLHKYVFVDRGGGALAPTEVVTGKTGGDWSEIRAGLKAGERVAASGTFLLSSEAQLQSALPKWSSP